MTNPPSGVVTNPNGTLSLEELTADDITSLLSQERKKGQYKQVILDFVNSGNLYLDVNTVPGFTEKEQSAIVQSLKLNLKKLDVECAVVKKDTHTLIINKAVHAAMLEAAANKE